MKYAIFDLDGTLLDSMWVWDDIDRLFLENHGIIADDDISEKVKTLSLRQSAELLKSTFNMTASVEEIINEIAAMGEDKYKNDVELKPFVMQTLEKFKNQNVRMCIATASVRKNVDMVLNRLNILDYFDFVITSEDVTTGKSDPEIYHLCAKNFGAAPSDIIVFEDAFHAAQTAKSAGFNVVGVYDKSSQYDAAKLKDICDFYINSFEELEVVL